MSFLYDESITNFFRRVNSKEDAKKMRKRKRLEDDASSDNKEPKVQQKLAFSNGSQTKGSTSTGLSRQRTSKSPSLKRGESSKSRPSTATPPPVDASLRVSAKETISFANALPTPLTAKRPAVTRMTRSFLPNADQPTLTPRPTSPRRTADLPTPVTMPRRAIHSKPSPPRRVRSQTLSCELPSPEPSQASSISSEYEEAMAVEEGQRDEYYQRVDWELPMPSQKVIPSSQSQADGCFDSTSRDPESSTPPSSVFLAPRPPDKGPHGLSRIADEEDRGQTQGKQPSSVPRSPVEDLSETSLIKVHDGEEYVLSSQSQLVLPFHVSPRKNRGRVSSASSSIPSDTPHSDEIVPSSQSQFEKELDEMCDSDDLPHGIDNKPLKVESSCQPHSAPEHTFSSSEELSTSTQILVEETPENYYDLALNDQELGSATEEESGDEGDNMFPPIQSSASPALTRFHESAPSSSSQESLSYPSSLPDAVKEFREMFGVGDGSYPDDFPMSLRD